MAFNCVVDHLPMGGAAIASVEDVRFVGLSMDRNLRFRYHIGRLNKKLAVVCYCVRTMRRELRIEVARTIQGGPN